MFTININFISSATQTNTTYAYLLILLVNKQQTAGPHSNHDKFINSIHSCCESKHYVNKKKYCYLLYAILLFLYVPYSTYLCTDDKKRKELQMTFRLNYIIFSILDFLFSFDCLSETRTIE